MQAFCARLRKNCPRAAFQPGKYPCRLPLMPQNARLFTRAPSEQTKRQKERLFAAPFACFSAPAPLFTINLFFFDKNSVTCAVAEREQDKFFALPVPFVVLERRHGGHGFHICAVEHALARHGEDILAHLLSARDLHVFSAGDIAHVAAHTTEQIIVSFSPFKGAAEHIQGFFMRYLGHASPCPHILRLIALHRGTTPAALKEKISPGNALYLQLFTAFETVAYHGYLAVFVAHAPVMRLDGFEQNGIRGVYRDRLAVFVPNR